MLLFLTLALALQDTTPVIKVTTRQVQVSVVVHDRKGQPVTGLTQEDFVIYDKGQPQQIRYFAVEDAQKPAAPAPALPKGVVANRYVNTGAGSAAMPNALTVILLDSLNSSFADRNAARNGLLKFLGQLRAGDRVAIYSLENGLHVIHEFTSDTASLVRALEKRQTGTPALGASTPEDVRTGDAEVDALLDRASTNISAFFQESRTDTTLRALESIANHLAGVPGRKNLIWLSGGFPLFTSMNPDGSLGTEFRSFGAEMQEAVRSLSQAMVAIYPVDARGLMTGFDFTPSMARGSAPSTVARPPIPGRSAEDQRAAQAILQTHSTMYEIAGRTGGVAFMNTNDLAGSIRRAVEDTSVTYNLAYTPSHNEWDGRFREIHVRLDRPGVEVRHRSGYFATPDTSGDAKVREAAVRSARDSALIATGLGLAAHVEQFPTVAAPHVKVRFVMNALDLAFTQDAKGVWNADLDLLMTVRAKDGSPLAELSNRLRVSLNQQQYERSLKAGIPLNADLDAKGTPAWARVVVRDAATGLVGSVDLPLVP